MAGQSNGMGIYNTNRRNFASTKTKLRGPVLEDDSAQDAKTPTLGQLSIVDKRPTKKDLEELLKSDVAASKELLVYFYRLSTLEAQNEQVEINYIEALIAAGADINVCDKTGQTLLHAAARDWHPDVALFMIKNGADVNKQDNYGRSPIFIAASLNYVEMIQLLANNGADIDMTTFGENQTPLHYAVKNEAVSSIKCLLKLGGDLSAPDYKGRIPLYIAVQQGCEESARFLLDYGCPAATLDDNGVSAFELMIEKMPSVAQTALSQYLCVDNVVGTKEYYLGALETGEAQTNAVELIVKFNELDLLCHPVVQRLLELKWKEYGHQMAWFYLAINSLYVILWSVLAYVASATKSPFAVEPQNYWKIVLLGLAVILTVVFLVDQTYRARATQKSEQLWRTGRIEALEKDMKYCHPQWPHEKEALAAQIATYNGLVGDQVKNVWNYLEWLLAAAVLVLAILRGIHMSNKKHSIDFAAMICMTLIVFIVYLRFMKACSAFKVTGQFVSVLEMVLVAVGQFAFLFFIFFIPFVIAFWVLFGGDENAKTITKKGYPHLSNAFRKFNDVVYSVWTLTLIVGFPTAAIQAIDSTVAEVYLFLYYLVMSVLCLNLFIALLSQFFSKVHNISQTYTLLERAKALIAYKTYLSKNTKYEFETLLHEKCNPLTERIGFRESNEKGEDKGMELETIKNNAKFLVARLNDRIHSSSKLKIQSIVKTLKHKMRKLESSQNDFEISNATLEKLKVENMKIAKILGLKVKSTKKSVRMESSS